MTLSRLEVISKVLARRIEQRLDQSGLSPIDANARGRFTGLTYPPENPAVGNGWVQIVEVEPNNMNFGQFEASVVIWLLFPSVAQDFAYEAVYRIGDPTYEFGFYEAFQTPDFTQDSRYTISGTTRPQFAALRGFDNASDSYKNIVVGGNSVEGNISVSVQGSGNIDVENLNGAQFLAFIGELKVYWSNG